MEIPPNWNFMKTKRSQQTNLISTNKPEQAGYTYVSEQQEQSTQQTRYKECLKKVETWWNRDQILLNREEEMYTRQSHTGERTKWTTMRSCMCMSRRWKAARMFQVWRHSDVYPYHWSLHCVFCRTAAALEHSTEFFTFGVLHDKSHAISSMEIVIRIAYDG